MSTRSVTRSMGPVLAVVMIALWLGGPAPALADETCQSPFLPKVFLVDPDGYIRNVYSAGFLVADLVVNDVKTVLMER